MFWLFWLLPRFTCEVLQVRRGGLGVCYDDYWCMSPIRSLLKTRTQSKVRPSRALLGHKDKVQVYHSLFGVLAFLAFTKVHLWSLTSKTRRTRGVLWRRLTHVTYPFSTKNKNTKQSTTIRNDLFADWSSRRKCKICCCRCRRRQLRPTVLLRKLNWLKDTHKSSTDNQ